MPRGNDEIIHMNDLLSGDNEDTESSAMAKGQAQNSTGPDLLYNSKPFKKLKASDCYIETSKNNKDKTEQICHVMWNSLLNTGWRKDTKLDNQTLLVNCIGDIRNAKQMQEARHTLKSIIKHLFKNDV